MKTALHVLLYLVGLLGGAQLIQKCGLGFQPYQPGAFYTPDGTEVPLAEIANFLTGGGYLGGAEGPRPRGRLTPGLRVKQGYDRPRWDYFDAQGCILVEHNSIGFRDEEFPIEKPAGEYRVLTIGDSFTYGSGVLGEDAWPQVLERGLATGGRPVQVINGGFAAGSYAPAGYDTWLESDGFLLQPDLVVIGFCLNDMGDGNDIPMLSWSGVTTCNYQVALLDQVMTWIENKRRMSSPTDYAAIVAQRPGTWNATQQALRNLQRLCKGRGVPLVVAVIPMISGLDQTPGPYAPLHAMIETFCQQQGILHVDLRPNLAGRHDTDLWVHPTDQHPNHLGQKLLGDGVLHFLQQHGLDGRR